MKQCVTQLLAASVLVVFCCGARATTPTAASSDCVILLHGMARTSASMDKMEEALMGEGYSVVNESYPSREHPIEVLAPLAIDAGLEQCGDLEAPARVHFVTHSLGGILVRYYYEDQDLGQLGRVVMLAPPNQGSKASDAMRGLPGFDWINGPAGRQIGKGEDSVPLKLGTPAFEFGVIAGDRTIDPITSAVLPNPDDGKVSVADTKLDGMTDFALISVSHAYIMQDEEVIALVKNYLRSGRFKPAQ